MQFIKDGPEIPDELITHHESGNLVIFCGSGISVPANLPTFDDLVVRIYNHNNISEGHFFNVKKEYIGQYPLEKKCYESFLYDRVLYLLERRLGVSKTLCRSALQDILLEIKGSPDFRTHEAILDLSKDFRGARRLVTTNFDHCFDLCRNEITHFSAAPMLPVPRKGKWNSLVYLHGKIDRKRDSNGANLVVTSADFGSAYLTERWASRFTAELFRNFHILFLGYSLNDPIMRYISDAIAADDSLETTSDYWKKRYILAKVQSSKKEDYREWESFGIDPIFCKNYTELHSTLWEWARFYRSGLTGKDNVIKEASFVSPKSPYQNDPLISKQLSILQESKLGEKTEISGHYAKVFLESIPIPPIQWLPVLDKCGLLGRGKESGVEVPIASHKNMSCISSPDKPTCYLWRWLSKHLDSRELVEYIIEKGAYLHPIFKHYICLELSNNIQSVPKPYLDFWNLLLWDQKNHSTFGSSISYQYVLPHIPEEAVSTIFLKLLQPSIHLGKPPIWMQKSDKERTDENLLYLAKGEVVIEDFHVVNRMLYDNNSFPECMIEHLPVLTHYLRQTLYLAKVFDGGAELSLLDVQSIADSDQNRISKSWTFLVRVIRDVWISADKERPKIADAVIGLWMNEKHLLFSKLILHAYSVSKRIPIAQKMSFLLAERNSWIVSYKVRRDLFNFIRGNSAIMTAKQGNQILERVISLLDMKSENKIDKDRVAWLFLIKMKDLGFVLNPTTSSVLRELSNIHKNWERSSDNRDELSMYMHPMEVGYKSDIDSEKLFKMSLQERISFLVDTESRYYNDRAQEFQQMTIAHIVTGYKTLVSLANDDLWCDSVWENGLSGLKETKYGWAKLTKILTEQAPDSFLDSILFTLTHDWLIGMCSAVPADSTKERLLFALLDRLLAIQMVAQQRTKPGLIQTDIGSVVEVVINRAGLRNLAYNDGLPNSIKNRLEIVVRGSNDSNKYGCSSIFSRLFYFFAVDPDWTGKNLLPLLWRESNHFVSAWSGFLMNPRSNLSLLNIIAPLLLHAISRSIQFEEGLRAGIFHLFARISLDASGSYTAEEISRELLQMDHYGRKEVSHFLHLRMANIDKERRSNYWEEFMLKLLNLWPKNINVIHPDVSDNMYSIVLLAEESFPQAFLCVKPITSSIDNFDQLLYSIKDEGLEQRYPKEILDLLNHAIGATVFHYQAEKVKEIVNDCIRADPSLRDSVNHRNIERKIQI